MTELLKYQVNNRKIIQNQDSLSDTIRMALYQNNSTLFGMLDYDNDSIFLEPTLFCHFLSNIDKTATIPLAQCLIGYISVTHRPESILVKADLFGLVNLPNLGYVRANPYEMFTLDLAQVEHNLIPNQFLERVGELRKVEGRANFVVAKLQRHDQTVGTTDRPSMGRNFGFF